MRRFSTELTYAASIDLQTEIAEVTSGSAKRLGRRDVSGLILFGWVLFGVWIVPGTLLFGGLRELYRHLTKNN